MTAEQIIKACKENQYVIFRLRSGLELGFNCKCVLKGKNKDLPSIEGETNIQSFRPCNFMEYLQYKQPFLV